MERLRATLTDDEPVQWLELAGFALGLVLYGGVVLALLRAALGN
jgi:hypothetical protein